MYFSKFKYTFSLDTPDKIETAKATDEVLTRVINFSPNPSQQVFIYAINWFDARSLSRAAVDTNFRTNNSDNRGVNWLDTIETIDSIKNQLSSDYYKDYALKIFEIIFTEQNTSITKLINSLDFLIRTLPIKDDDYRKVFYEDYDGYNRGGLSGNNFYIKNGGK